MIEIEVISQSKGTNKAYSKIMTLEEYRSIEKKKGWTYKAYQIGFYQNPNKIILK